jgi:predicted lipoprotein with Yx(FWY)xxD motif
MKWILITLAATVGLAACSNGTSAGGYGAGSSSTSSSAPGAAAAAPATVSTASVGDLGTVLVDGNGMTLYLFESDTGTTSTCTGSCASTWPALASSGSADATGKADGSMLGTSTHPDGSTQVTYAGHPLYVYSGDQAAGDANGEGLGGVWFAVTTQGTAAQASGSSKSSGGYGNGYGG